MEYSFPGPTLAGSELGRSRYDFGRLPTGNLLKLSVVFLASGLTTTGALFLLRVFVARQEGVYAASQFQAASALAMVYVGFVLQAMGTDFYPRLTSGSGNWHLYDADPDPAGWHG